LQLEQFLEEQDEHELLLDEVPSVFSLDPPFFLA
jgi:hypothetical protein